MKKYNSNTNFLFQKILCPFAFFLFFLSDKQVSFLYLTVLTVVLRQRQRKAAVETAR